VERARLLIEQAEALGEPPEDPLSLWSILYGFWAAQYTAYNGDAIRELATQFLELALKQGATIPLMVGHRLIGTSFLYRGEFSNALAHFDRAIALYDPAEHRQLRTRFGQDIRVVILCQRAWVLWHLGYPMAALVDAEQSLKEAREIAQAATLAYGLSLPRRSAAAAGYGSTPDDTLLAVLDPLLAPSDTGAVADGRKPSLGRQMPDRRLQRVTGAFRADRSGES